MRTYILFPVKLILISLLFSCAETRTKTVSIIETTDVHGVILPFDFIEKEALDASLASCFTYIRQVRSENDATILLDNGDNLQGQPEVYYYNFIDTLSPHFLAEVMNFMQYDAGTVGNHDIETGHAVYDRLVKEYDFPLLAANAVDAKTGDPYFNPFYIIERKGIRIAVFGMVTPEIPNWLPPELYSGIEFRDMLETAKKWIPVILKEKPDLVVGLFHSGWNKIEEAFPQALPLNENGSAEVAYYVPGFDIIFNGHDHKISNEKIINSVGDSVLILDGGSRAEKIAQANITFSYTKRNRKSIKGISGHIVNVADYLPDPEFISKFSGSHKTIESYVNRVIGNSTSTISSRDAFFGPSAFVDMIHSIQLEITGADISFAAPLSFDVSIHEGPVTIGDMFKLYRFENMLYTMSLSGEEIKKYLEYSYADWFNTMKGPDDYMLKLRSDSKGNPVVTNGRVWLKNQLYNFDSAVGIDYVVDVSKKEGSRITIAGFTDGRPFEANKIYTVAVNSYRGNGGGGHFTEGAGIEKSQLRSRLLYSTERDLRYYMMKKIEEKNTVNPKPYNNWQIIPAKWANNAIPKEYELLFGKEK